MALADQTNSSEAIVDGATTFMVGPLSLADVAELRRRHVVRLLEAFDHYKDLLLHEGKTQRAYGAASVFLEMADAVAHTIALAAGEPERILEASRLPIGTQLQALTVIAKLSLANTSVVRLPSNLDDVVSQLKRLRPEEIN